MNKIKLLYLFFIAVTFLVTGCSSSRNLIFADREWHISSHYGQIIDKDTTFRFTFGNVLIPDPLVIVSSKDSLAKYPGMDKFLGDILTTANIDNSEILFYAPEMQSLFVKLNSGMPPLRPSSISSPLSDDKPYTMWIYEGDMERWNRKPEEMYTYTYFNKKKKQLLIVDCYDYGDTPIAQITIFQNRNKATDNMGLPAPGIRSSFNLRPDYRKYMEYIEPISNRIETRRGTAIGNYKIGQEQKLRDK